MKIFSKNFHKILTNKETCEPVLQNVPEDAVQIILQNNQSIAEEVEKSDYVQNSIARLAARKSGNVKVTTSFEISNLKELMELEGVSTRALSQKINVERKSIRLWLAGKFFPRYDALIKLSVFSGVRIDYLLGRDDTFILNSASVAQLNICAVALIVAKPSFSTFLVFVVLNIFA